jgi:hypothetical protein
MLAGSVDVGMRDHEPRVTTRSGRRWYAEHRSDVLARLAVAGPGGRTARRAAELLALAFDDDPAVVARARVVRG